MAHFNASIAGSAAAALEDALADPLLRPESPSKKARLSVEDDAAESKTETAESETEAAESKTEATEETEGCGAALEDECTVCKEGADDGATLSPHHCPLCTPRAWFVCKLCDMALRSRVCPVCRGPYAPMDYYDFPMPRLNAREAEDRLRALKLKAAISHSNIVAINATDRTACFLLPQSFTTDCRRWLVARNVPLPPDLELGAESPTLSLAVGGTAPAAGTADPPPGLRWTSSLWDAIEAHTEGGEGGDAASTTLTRGVEAVLTVLYWRYGYDAPSDVPADVRAARAPPPSGLATRRILTFFSPEVLELETDALISNLAGLISGTTTGQ